MVVRRIKNSRDGFHFNSRHWQGYKKTAPRLDATLFGVCVGMILGLASLFKSSRNAGIKFEQGYKQKEFLAHLFELFHDYTFMSTSGERINLRGKRKGLVKSFWFKSFSHPSFTELWNLFLKDGKRKSIYENLITEHLTDFGFAYWVMCDGSLQKDRNCLILHTQSFTRSENLLATREMNQKWGLSCTVISHKQDFCVIKSHAKDALTLHLLLKPYLIESMRYKLPLFTHTHSLAS